MFSSLLNRIAMMEALEMGHGHFLSLVCKGKNE